MDIDTCEDASENGRSAATLSDLPGVERRGFVIRDFSTWFLRACVISADCFAVSVPPLRARCVRRIAMPVSTIGTTI